LLPAGSFPPTSRDDQLYALLNSWLAGIQPLRQVIAGPVDDILGGYSIEIGDAIQALALAPLVKNSAAVVVGIEVGS
jgi:hypothetical protein